MRMKIGIWINHIRAREVSVCQRPTVANVCSCLTLLEFEERPGDLSHRMNFMPFTRLLWQARVHLNGINGAYLESRARLINFDYSSTIFTSFGRLSADLLRSSFGELLAHKRFSFIKNSERTVKVNFKVNKFVDCTRRPRRNSFLSGKVPGLNWINSLCLKFIWRLSEHIWSMCL